jgi:hypothetical protein
MHENSLDARQITGVITIIPIIVVSSCIYFFCGKDKVYELLSNTSLVFFIIIIIAIISGSIAVGIEKYLDAVDMGKNVKYNFYWKIIDYIDTLLHGPRKI